MSKLASMATGNNPYLDTALKFADFGGEQAMQDKKQNIALRLLSYKVEQAQAQAAIEKKKLDLWNSVGTPTVGDKSTAGDVSKIVDTGKVGGRDAGIVNDGEVADDKNAATIPADTQSNSSLVNMMKGLQPTISPAGNMILSRPKAVKPVDQTKIFSYAKKLADQSIVDSGKTRKDVSSEDYKTLIDNNMPKANQFYGQNDATQGDNSSSDKILNSPKSAKPMVKRYDEARTFGYAKRLADQAIIQSGKRKKDISPDDYKILVNDQIPQAEKYLYGRPLSQPQEAAPKAADATGVAQAVQMAMDVGKGNIPAPGAAAPAAQAYQEGQTAVNPKTGKRLQFKGGKWHPLN